MALSDQQYTVRWALPDLIEKGADSSLVASVYLDGALVEPTSATVTVYNASNEKVVDAGVATIASSKASYTVTGATTSGQALGDGWRIEWAITIGGVVTNSQNNGSLVRWRNFCPIADQDIYRRVGALNPNSAAVISSQTTYQDSLDEAHVTISQKLVAAGRRPWLIMSPSSLREVYLHLALSYIYDNLSASLSNVDFLEKAGQHREEYSAAFRALNFVYDLNEDGQGDTGLDGEPGRAGTQTIFLTSRH
jgi:hypothetical protein|tara:strand:+ start:1046 stop:1795 length:750 start_codon:yes stop_codon:yes gene_type:complete